MGAWFPKDKGGGEFNLEPMGGAKCQKKNPSSCQPPSCLTHLFLSYSPTNYILQELVGGSYFLGAWGVWVAVNSSRAVNLDHTLTQGEGFCPFFPHVKEGSKIPLTHKIFSFMHSHAGRNFFFCMPSHGWASSRFWFSVCFPSCEQPFSSISLGWEFNFRNDQWVGFLPRDLDAYPYYSPS